MKAGSVIVDTTGMGAIYVVIGDGDFKKTTDWIDIDVIKGSIDFLIKNSDIKIATPSNRTKRSTGLIKNKLPMVSNRIYAKINNEEFNIPKDSQLKHEKNFSNEPVWKSKNGDCSIIIDTGRLTVDPAIDYHAIYSNRKLALSWIIPLMTIGALDYLRTIAYMDLDLDLKLSLHAGENFNDGDKIELFTHFSAVPVGYIVFGIQTSVDMYFNVNLDTKADITTEYELKANSVIGIEMPDGPLSTPVFFKEFKKIKENFTPQLEGALTLTERFEIRPRVEVYLYGIVGVNGEVIPYQEFVLNAHALNSSVDWDCEFRVGIDGKIGFDLSAFHFSEATWEIIKKDFYGPSIVLYSAPHLKIISGNNQEGYAGQQLANPLRVKAVDNFGNMLPIPVNVYWGISQGAESLAQSNSNYSYQSGYAQNYLTLGHQPGTNKASAYLKKANGVKHNTKIFSATGTASANTPPTASFSISPTSGTTTTPFSFNATACSDNEDQTSQLQVRWDWENDGTWNTGYSTNKTASHQYTTDGTKTIKVEVKDTGGLTATTTRQVTVTSANIKNGLVGYWDLSNNCNDNYGLNDGPNHGCTFGGTCANFSNNSYIDITNVGDDLYGTQELTISAWAKAEEYYHHNPIVALVTYANGHSYEIYSNSKEYKIWVMQYPSEPIGGLKQTTILPEIKLNTWYHFVLTINNNSISAYVNGTLIKSFPASTNGSFNGGDQGKFIGRQYGTNYASDENYFHGQIKRVGIWKKTLSNQEVDYLYNNGNGRSYSNLPN